MAMLAVAAGMGGELHLRTGGFGTIAMLDLVSYAIALPIIASQWSRMGKFMRRSLILAFAWTAAAMLANMFNFFTLKYWVKCVFLASSSWAIMATSYLLLRRFPMGYMWYLVGAGIGGWIGLYYFRSGALEGFATGGDYGGAGYGIDLLQEKQIYPSVARGILYGCVLPLFLWWKKLPIFLVVCATFFAGLFVLFHGGSRSNFGIFCAAASAGFLVAYGAQMLKRIARHPVMMAILVGIAVMAMFGSYKFLATSGALGENQRNKYEREFGGGRHGAIEGRAGFGQAFRDATESFFIGKGCHIRNHSAMANALACEGIVGFLFWLYFYMQILWWTCWRLPYSGKWATYIVLMALMAAWDAFGSPFGTRHKFFVLMAMVALCHDNKYYGIGSLFGASLQFARK